MAVNNEEFAKRVESVRTKLYKTALTYLGSEALALDAVDEAVYKALCGKWKLRQPEFFDTWITRILINECHMKSMVEPSPSGVSHLWCEMKSWANASNLFPLIKGLFCCFASLANIPIVRLPDCLVFPMQRFPTEKKMHSGGCG